MKFELNDCVKFLPRDSPSDVRIGTIIKIHKSWLRETYDIMIEYNDESHNVYRSIKRDNILMKRENWKYVFETTQVKYDLNIKHWVSLFVIMCFLFARVFLWQASIKSKLDNISSFLSTTTPMTTGLSQWNIGEVVPKENHIDEMISCYSGDIMWDYCIKTFDGMASNISVDIDGNMWPTVQESWWKFYEYCNAPIPKDEFGMSVEDFNRECK